MSVWLSCNVHYYTLLLMGLNSSGSLVQSKGEYIRLVHDTKNRLKKKTPSILFNEVQVKQQEGKCS